MLVEDDEIIEHRHHRGDGRDRHLLERRHARRTVAMGDMENAARLLRGCRPGDEPHNHQPGRAGNRSKAGFHWHLCQYGRGGNPETTASLPCDVLTSSCSIFRVPNVLLRRPEQRTIALRMGIREIWKRARST